MEHINTDNTIFVNNFRRPGCSVTAECVILLAYATLGHALATNHSAEAEHPDLPYDSEPPVLFQSVKSTGFVYSEGF